MSILSVFVLTLVCLASSRSGEPGDRVPCMTDEYTEEQLKNDPNLQVGMDHVDDHWKRNPNYGGKGGRRRLASSLPDPLTIPINFHIIKSPTTQIIGYEQIISQIRVLNLDFTKQNTDINQVPSEFKPFEGDYKMNFALNKIIRLDTSNSYFDYHANKNQMKYSSSGGSNSVDSSHSLNFWVCEINFLGFATFPGGSMDIDGVVVDSQVFGSVAYDHKSTGTDWDISSTFGLGRTATHEIGHWLNLRHIWGDGNCTYDDGVSDTPVDDGPNYGCPSGTINSCNSNDMFMNFMDYTNDNCMYMFTDGQRDKSDDLFLTGGFRQSFVDYVNSPTFERFVNYFYFVNGNGAQCDNGHTRRSVDLNAGAGGDYIYLCVSYSNNPYVDVITDIAIITGNGTSCSSGYEKIDSDLNEDAGGSYIYVCYKKESQSAAKSIITDLNTFSFGNSNSGEYKGYTLEPFDLNHGSGGSFIYIGYKSTTDGLKVKDKLYYDEILTQGQRLTAADGHYEAVMQSDGNFVIYNKWGGYPIWATYTYNSDATHLRFQTDNHVVVYNDNGVHRWASGTYGANLGPNSFLIMQTDGNLCVYGQNLDPYWCTMTHGQWVTPFNILSILVAILSITAVIQLIFYIKKPLNKQKGDYDLVSMYTSNSEF